MAIWFYLLGPFLFVLLGFIGLKAGRAHLGSRIFLFLVNMTTVAVSVVTFSYVPIWILLFSVLMFVLGYKIPDAPAVLPENWHHLGYYGYPPALHPCIQDFRPHLPDQMPIPSDQLAPNLPVHARADVGPSNGNFK
jgi:voltage-gated potassium channel Kch